MVVAHDVNEKDRTNDIQISGDVTFESMLLSPLTLEGLKNSGFYKPSPVQLLGIPMGKCGFDLLLEAKSGTGKTAVFAVIALEKICLTKGLQVIILAPTREIAAQICNVIKEIGSCYEGLHIEVVMGGLPVKDDIQKFSNDDVHIVVGSPGRLKHLISDKHIDISTVRLLVLDEADKLMENSFINDIKHIYARLPKQKQVILSSATFPENSKLFIDQFVYSAQHICPNSNHVLLGVAQKTTIVEHNSNIVRQTLYRYKELVNILIKIPFKQCLIFCNYQARVAELHKLLTKNKWPAEQLHGQQDQIDRLDALKTLQEYKCRILVSTDLASRGIDASNIDLVINFEPPFEWPTYLHRIGRAGRFGSYGTAITILSKGIETKRFMRLIEPLNEAINFTTLWNNDNDDQENNKNKKEVVDTKEMSVEKQVLITEAEPFTKEESGRNGNIVIKEQTVQASSVNSLDSIDLSENTEEICTKNIQNFEELCKSFETSLIDTKPKKLQSFSDFVNSYENLEKEVIENGYEYKCLRIPEKTKIKEELAQRNVQAFNTSKQNENKCTFPNTSENANMYFSDNKKIEINDITEVIETFENEYDFSYAHELGLPTAFLSSKDKRYYENLRKKIELKKKERRMHEAAKIWEPRPFLSRNYNRETNSFHVTHKKSSRCGKESNSLNIPEKVHNLSKNDEQSLNRGENKHVTNVESNQDTYKSTHNNKREYKSFNKEQKPDIKEINHFKEINENTFKGRYNSKKEFNKSSYKVQKSKVKENDNFKFKENNEDTREYKKSNKEQEPVVQEFNNFKIEDSKKDNFMGTHNNIREFINSQNKDQNPICKKVYNLKNNECNDDTLKGRYKNTEVRSKAKKIDSLKIDENKNTFKSKVNSIREYDISYYNWYHQLKSKVKQIEMLVYIDELSKIRM